MSMAAENARRWMAQFTDAEVKESRGEEVPFNVEVSYIAITEDQTRYRIAFHYSGDVVVDISDCAYGEWNVHVTASDWQSAVHQAIESMRVYV